MGRSRLFLIRFAIVAAGVAACAATRGVRPEGDRVLDAAMHHLGNDKTPEWKEAPADPEPAPLVVAFESAANAQEWVLELTARDVDSDWQLELNGAGIGSLPKAKNTELRPSLFPLPIGAVVAGKNVLRAVPRDPNEDITLGRIALHERSLRELLRLGRVDVTVTDQADGSRLPARITVADASGKLTELYYSESRTTAVRPGIAYTCDGVAALEIPEGRVTIWASRGMEWSCAQQEVEVKSGAKQSVAFALAREVDTTGWIAADTHIHTLTFSGHGDASVEERMVTLAGEGVELAIATDHNHQIDYRPYQKKLDLNPWFTPVVGNEVTTDNGHMNAFPFPPGDDVPPFKETDWAKLVAGIRAKGAKVVILNHPRWPEKGKDPFTSFGFDDRSGERRTGQKFTFDCLELVNSDAPTQPWEVVLPGWYGLLDRGEVFTGVGASDSHAVGVIVGQGRTYVPSKTDDPAKIDVDDACRQFKEGRVSVSLGMFATIDVDGHGMGETIQQGQPGQQGHQDPPKSSSSIEAKVLLRHPSWVTPEKIDLVVDGVVAASVALAPGELERGDGRCALERRLRAPLPSHDCWVVAVATGARVTAPFWAMSQPRAVAVTNPIFLDRDGVPGWSSPRATAQRLLGRERVAEALAKVDDAVALQMLELMRDQMRTAAQDQLEALATGRTALLDWAKSQR